MLKLFRSVLIVLLFSVLFLGIVDIVSAAEPPRTFRVGAYNNDPKIYKDVNDKPAGVFVDVLNYIAKKENWSLVYVWGTWDEGLTRLENGEIDIMPDVAVSPEREKRFDFTKETVLNSWAVIYVQKSSNIGSLLDLNGKRISILKSSVYESGEESIEQYLAAFGIKANIVEVNSYREALDYLSLGRVDAAIVSYVSGLTNEGNYTNIKATRIFLKPTELRFALTKGVGSNKYLTEKLDYWVKNLKSGSDGYFNQTLEKYGLGSLETENGPTPLPQSRKNITPIEVLKTTVGIAALVLSFLIIALIISRKSLSEIMRFIGRGKK